jgi:hypothetical protein
MKGGVLDLYIGKKNIDEKTFYFTDLGEKNVEFGFLIEPEYFEKELKEIVRQYPFIRGILKNATIDRESGDRIIKLGKNNIFFFTIECGFQGKSVIKVKSENNKVIDYLKSKSRKNPAWFSWIAVVETSLDYVEFEWKRKGFLKRGEAYHGISVIYFNGRIEHKVI